MVILLRFTSFAFALTLLLAGCGAGSAVGEGTRQKVYPVTGSIKRNGAPVPDAVVTFSPRGKQPVAFGRTNTEGKFTLTTYPDAAGDGAAAGEYLVLVLKESPAAPAPVMHGPDFDSSKLGPYGPGNATAGNRSAIPVKYSSPTTTDLRATVKADGPNEFPFDLK
jgi:hypothetical protein